MDYSQRYSHDEVQSYLSSHFKLNENLINRLSSNDFVMRTSALVVTSVRAGMGMIVVLTQTFSTLIFLILRRKNLKSIFTITVFSSSYIRFITYFSEQNILCYIILYQSKLIKRRYLV